MSERSLADVEAILTPAEFILYLKGKIAAGDTKGTLTGRLPCTEPATSNRPKSEYAPIFLPPAPGCEFVWDWFIERIGTGNIFRANGYNEASIQTRFKPGVDLILQRIELSKRQVPINRLGRNIDTHA